MLVRCPECKTEFRLVDYGAGDRVIRYLCPGCRGIVGIDLELDEVRSSSSSGSYRSIERRRTVLVADDSPEILETARSLLEGAGYQVFVAADGLEALRIAREAHPDVIVLDLLMPRLTGFDVLREILSDDRVKDTPVLAMSGVYKDNVLAFLQQLGARGFLDKQQLRDSLVFRVQGLAPASGAA